MNLTVQPASRNVSLARQRILEVERVLIDAVGSLEPTDDESRRRNHQIHQEGDARPGEDENVIDDGEEDSEGVQRKIGAEEKGELEGTADAKCIDGQGGGEGQGEKVDGVGGDDGRSRGNGDVGDPRGNNLDAAEKGDGDGNRGGESKTEDAVGGFDAAALDVDAARTRDTEVGAGESGGKDEMDGAGDQHHVNGCYDGIGGGDADGDGTEGDGEAGEELLAQVWQDPREKPGAVRSKRLDLSVQMKQFSSNFCCIQSQPKSSLRQTAHVLPSLSRHSPALRFLKNAHSARSRKGGETPRCCGRS